MVKLTKQDKIEIFHIWQDYGIDSKGLSRRYRINPSTINYVLALINRYGTAVLERLHTHYPTDFKKWAFRLVLFKEETTYQIILDLGLKSRGILVNWLRQYRENEYKAVNHQKGRLPHTQTSSGNRAVKPRKRIQKKLQALVKQRS